MTINTGGPAFPTSFNGEPQKYAAQDVARGMTLRQWYAGMVMQGLCAGWASRTGEHTVPMKEFGDGTDAHMAFKIADSMLAHEEAEAKKQEGEPETDATQRRML